jgi:hypothetical protein
MRPTVNPIVEALREMIPPGHIQMPDPPMADELPDCDRDYVLKGLMRATQAQTVLRVRNAPSPEPDELRWCRAEIITAEGDFVEVAFHVEWVSKAEHRIWVQMAGARRM